jgi:hypothetical protein
VGADADDGWLGRIDGGAVDGGEAGLGGTGDSDAAGAVGELLLGDEHRRQERAGAGGAAGAVEQGKAQDRIVGLHRRVDRGLQGHRVGGQSVGGGVLARGRDVVLAAVGEGAALVSLVGLGVGVGPGAGRVPGSLRGRGGACEAREASARQGRDDERAHGVLIS